MLHIRQVRSPIGRKSKQRATLHALGLKNIDDVSVKSQDPQVLGMVDAVAHLIEVQSVDSGEVK